ncbi:MAG: hypothetical protein PHV59_00880, partial [Victivallales bacterium]|nr:hypothetical protein [Victivallales bacterium]
FAGVFNVLAAEVAEESKARKLLIAKIERTVEAEEVLKVLQKFNLDLMKARKDKEMLPLKQYSLCSTRIDIWFKYRWFIADTGLSRNWLKKLKELVDYMLKMQNLIEIAQHNRTTDSVQYQQAVKYYEVAYKRFVEILKKPVKVSSQSVRSSKLKKVLWQREMRKKYRINEKIREPI